MLNLRDDFPILRGNKLIFFDSAASAQKPEVVLRAVDDFYRTSYANVHRGLYQLSERATAAFEGTRERVREFVNAKKTEEIIFTRGTTEGINLVASSWGRTFVEKGDEILLTILEHHSNIVPWQLLAKERGAIVRFVELDKNGSLSLEDFERKLSKRTKMFAVTQLANALGVMPQLDVLIPKAQSVGARVLVDAAQSSAHVLLDVQALGCDFLVFSGHKIYGPTGVGVLFGKEELLNSMPPFLSGGDMIQSVTTEGTTFNKLPWKFEAGTPDITGVIGLGAATQYLQKIGFDKIAKHDADLTNAAKSQLAEIPGVTVLAGEAELHGLVTFVCKDVHPHDISQFLDRDGMAVRAGHHCAQPLMTYLGIGSSTRASFGVYNTIDELSSLARGVRAALKFFGPK